jgi:hypothetical protein
MNARSSPRPVRVSKKAQLYASNVRTDLTPDEIVELVQKRRWVHLGKTDVDFMLVWDHHRNVPVILLIAQEYRQDVVVSIWEKHYHGIPQGEPTALQIWFAWRCSLACPKKAPLAELAA